MHPALSTFADHVVKYRDALFLLAPPLYVVITAVAAIYTPTQHTLLVTMVSWLIVWVPTVFWVGLYSNSGRAQRKAGWLAGALLGLSAICDRAACDKHGVWATKALLLFFANIFADNELLAKRLALPTYTVPADHATEKKLPAEGSGHIDQLGTLTVLAICASCALGVYTIPTTFVLGLCSAIFAAAGLVIFRSIITAAAPDEVEDVKRRLTSGTMDLRASITGIHKAQRLAALRDVAIAIAIVCAIATLAMESSVSASNISWEPVYQKYNREWREVHNFRILQRFLWMLPVNAILNLLTFVMLYLIGAGHLTLVTVFSLIGTKLLSAPSYPLVFFMLIFDSTALIYLSERFLRETGETRRFRSLKIIAFLATAIAVGGLLSGRYNAWQTKPVRSNGLFVPSDAASGGSLDPIPIDMSKGHPAAQLMDAAEADFQKVLNRQSKSLAEAVSEYRRRYGIPPPPHFDKWYEFATRNGVVMVDEYDMIHEMLLPFWALKPSTIRSRIVQAIGHEDSALLAVAIRHGAVENYQNGEEWQQQATVGMMKQFVQYLPDMDLAFNMHDEPRVVVPINVLSSMVDKARDEVLPRPAKNASPQNKFSARPADLNDGTRFAESSTTNFNRFAHQHTWTHSRLSCPTTSQAQAFEDNVADNRKAYATSDLGFIYNQTAFSDICNSPSLSLTYGFFERPNAFNIIHELTPIFSQSKISSFQDILYPSPWYWVGKVGYDESHDTTWENKTNSLYWRGSSTGGYSRDGGWRRQHRQHIVRRLNAPDTAQILAPVRSSSKDDDATTNYTIADVDRTVLKGLIDVQFSHIGQCDPSDCEAQQEFFKVTERVDGQDAWYYKHLLDMDGNAFSGRFYSFLKSKSLTYKMALFREWHAEWLKPWVHYIPLTLRGDEHLDLVRWFSGTKVFDKDGDGKLDDSDADGGKTGGNGNSEGEKRARRMAERSTEWHDKVLRTVDFEVWFFRLLLEYGRVVDDHREEIGYPGP